MLYFIKKIAYREGGFIILEEEGFINQQARLMSDSHILEVWRKKYDFLFKVWGVKGTIGVTLGQGGSQLASDCKQVASPLS